MPAEETRQHLAVDVPADGPKPPVAQQNGASPRERPASTTDAMQASSSDDEVKSTAITHILHIKKPPTVMTWPEFRPALQAPREGDEFMPRDNHILREPEMQSEVPPLVSRVATDDPSEAQKPGERSPLPESERWAMHEVHTVPNEAKGGRLYGAGRAAAEPMAAQLQSVLPSLEVVTSDSEGSLPEIDSGVSSEAEE